MERIKMLTDYDIRKNLIERIANENERKRHRIIEELVICDGSSRVDIAVANGRLLGYEIKSDHDSLNRLENQVNNYDKTFEKTTIVVGRKFEDTIVNLVPSHWGIEVAYTNRYGNTSIKRIRASKINRNISKTHILDLLWNPEIKSLLKENNISGYSRENRTGLKNMAVKNICLPREIISFKIYGRD